MNDDISKSNSLTDLAARIRESHGAVRQMLGKAVEQAMTTGDMLLESKEQVERGKWPDWIKEHCEISDRTARLYMRLAKNRAVIEATGDIAGLTLNSAVRLLAPPKEDAEKDDDALEKTAAEINIKWAETKVYVAEMRKSLAAIRATFNTDEEWKAWLQQEFPEPTDPEEKEFSDLMGELILIAAGITQEE